MCKLSTLREAQSIKKKLFDETDAQLTLKLLKITPKENELEVRRSDSEFMKDYNSAAMQSSHIVNTTEGSEEILSTEAPTFE